MPFSSRPRGTSRPRSTAIGAALAATVLGLVAAPSAIANMTYNGTGGDVVLTGSSESNTGTGEVVTITQSGTNVHFSQTTLASTATGTCTATTTNQIDCTGITGAIRGNLGTGNDSITTDPGVTRPLRLDGDKGNDTIAGGSGNDCLVGGSAGSDTLNGVAGDDTLFGDDNGDTLNGGTGNDRLDGGTGNDTISGDSGIDRVIYGTNGQSSYNVSGCYTAGTRTHPVVLTLGGTGGEAGETDTINADVESAITGTDDDTLTGSAINNVLVGGDGNDTLNGAGGDDLLSGGLAGETTSNGDPDVYDGGPGTDGVTYSNLTAGGVTVTIDNVANDGLTSGPPHAPTDNVQTTVEKVYGTAFADTISGAGAPAGVSLFGNAGNDTLTGSPFNDFIDGGANTDTANCGLGSDIAINVETATSCND